LQQALQIAIFPPPSVKEALIYWMHLVFSRSFATGETSTPLTNLGIKQMQ
jgi:hypothetical protein